MRALAATVCCAALAFAGCGGGDDEGAKIPAKPADDFIKQLRQVEDDVNNQRCGGASFKIGQLKQRVAALPRDVSEEVRTNISDAVDELERLAADECREEEPETTEPETTEETTEDTTETTTETVPPTTTEEPPPTTTEEPTLTEEPPPADQGGGVAPPGQEDGG